MNSKIGTGLLLLYGIRTKQYLIIYFCIDSIFWTIGGVNLTRFHKQSKIAFNHQFRPNIKNAYTN